MTGCCVSHLAADWYDLMQKRLRLGQKCDTGIDFSKRLPVQTERYEERGHAAGSDGEGSAYAGATPPLLLLLLFNTARMGTLFCFSALH